MTDHGFQLEYPVGTVLYRTAGYISQPRVSPSGDAVAFLDHAVDNNSGVVVLVDRKGNRRVLSSRYAASEGLAWEPRGKGGVVYCRQSGRPPTAPRKLPWGVASVSCILRPSPSSCSIFRATAGCWWPMTKGG